MRDGSCVGRGERHRAQGALLQRGHSRESSGGGLVGRACPGTRPDVTTRRSAPCARRLLRRHGERHRAQGALLQRGIRASLREAAWSAASVLVRTPMSTTRRSAPCARRLLRRHGERHRAQGALLQRGIRASLREAAWSAASVLVRTPMSTTRRSAPCARRFLRGAWRKASRTGCAPTTGAFARVFGRRLGRSRLSWYAPRCRRPVGAHPVRDGSCAGMAKGIAHRVRSYSQAQFQ